MSVVTFSCLCTLLSSFVRGNVELLILHTSDMHARFDEIDANSNLINSHSNQSAKFGGFARLKTAVKQAREEAQKERIPSLFVNSGDTFQGTAFYTVMKENVVAPLIQALDIDVMTFGNHEFDDGLEHLSNYVKNITVPIVISNLDYQNEPEFGKLKLHKSFVLDKEGYKIGFVGYLTEETKISSITREIIFLDAIESVRSEAQKLRQQGVKIIFALGHSGFDVDKKIAENVPEISLIAGGHTNTFLYTPQDKPPSNECPSGPFPYIVTHSTGKKIPIIESYAYTKYLGKLWATFDNDGNFISARNTSNAVLMDSKIPQDESVRNLVKKFRQIFEKEVSQVLGRSHVRLEAWKANCKFEECILGNFVTDAFVDSAVTAYNGTEGWTDASIAVQQSGGLRTPQFEHDRNNITYEDLMTAIPFKNELVKVTMYGSTFIKILEHSVSEYTTKKGQAGPNSFLQISGAHVTFDIAKPVGQRVMQVELRCAKCAEPRYYPLNVSDTYTVIMQFFTYNGGDKFTMIKRESLHMKWLKHGETIVTDTDAVGNYLKKLEIIYPEVSGRLTILNEYFESSTSSSPLLAS